MSVALFVGGITVALGITNALNAYFSRGLKSAYDDHTRALIDNSIAQRELASAMRSRESRP